MPKVRLSITPDLVTEVHESELAVLRQQGLVLEVLDDNAPPGADDSADGQEAAGNDNNEES